MWYAGYFVRNIATLNVPDDYCEALIPIIKEKRALFFSKDKKELFAFENGLAVLNQGLAVGITIHVGNQNVVVLAICIIMV